MLFSIKLNRTSPSGFMLFILQLLVGGVYVFAGVVKLVDPVGASIKIHEYLEAFGLSFLQPLSTFLGVIAALIEFVLGISLILGVFKNTVIKLLLGVTLFFTVLTFILALTNPVTDCGCFGDAIKLSNWQTFYKNLFLLAAILGILKFKHLINTIQSVLRSWMLILLVTFIGAFISHYSYHHLPILDFRPFAVGNDLPKLMAIPEGAPVDEFKTVFYYSKNGETKEFDESNYPWQDSTWVFVEMKSELVKKGYEPPIHNFNLENPDKGDITAQVLQSSEFEFLLIVPIAEDIPEKAKTKIKELSENLANTGQYLTYVSASEKQDVNTLLLNQNNDFHFANADLTLLKTIIRSAAGLVILKDGIVLAKYNYKDFPHEDYLGNPLAAALIVKSTLKSKLIFLYLLLFLGAGILLILGINPKHK